MQTILRHKFILIGVAVLLAGLVWYGMSGTSSTSTTPDLVSTPAQSVGGAAGASDGGIVATLLTLRAVKLDGTIFTDPAFKNLKDFSTEIVPEAIGRPNPFAPLSSQALPTASSTKSAQIFIPTHR